MKTLKMWWDSPETWRTLCGIQRASNMFGIVITCVFILVKGADDLIKFITTK